MPRTLFGPAVFLSLLVAAAPLGAQTPTALRRGDFVSGRLAASDTMRFTLTVADSTFLLGTLTQADVPLAVRVLTPGGQQRLRVQHPGTGTLRFAAVAAEAGTYVLEVLAPSGRAATFRLALERQEPLARDPRRRTDQLLARFDAPDAPGAVVRVWRGGRTLYTRGYGMANLAYGVPYRPDTRTNIGSTSKQFTAFAILLLAERGALTLDDDIRRYLPELPARRDTIRVRHLLTHTSGLREFLAAFDMTERNVGRDWISDAEVLQLVQAQPALQNVPGAEFNYNNTAFHLAAQIVTRVSGRPFPEFMRDEVFLPLGMTRTVVRADRERIVPSAAIGYAADERGYRETGDLAGAMGAGAIYSTVEDLERWAQALDALQPTVGTRAIPAQMMADTELPDGSKTGYGMGLFLDTQHGLRRVHHGGADVAHRSMLVLYPEIDAGVSLQANHAELAPDLAFEIADAFFQDAMRRTSVPVAAGPYDPARMTAARFAAFEGRYALDANPSFVMRVFRDGTRFLVQGPGQPPLVLIPDSDSSFTMAEVPIGLRFRRGADGRVTGVTLLQGGEQQATRLPDGPGFAPSAAELAAYVGRYHSEELASTMTLTLRGDSLVLRQRRRDDAVLTPGSAPDTFTGRGLTLSIERDRNGMIVALYVENGRTRNVRFVRVSP